MFLTVACLSAHAGPIDDANALVKSASEMMTELGSMTPPPDAETINRVQQESLAKLNEARVLFENGGADSTDDAAVAYAYGDLLVRLGDIDLAAATLKNASELSPENADYALAYGTILVQLGPGHEAEATRALLAGVALAPDSAGAAIAHAQLAEVYRRTGLYMLALESSDLALAINPENSLAQFLKAVCLTRQGRFQEANTLMDTVATRAPTMAGDARGWLYDAVRDFERRNLWVANTAEEHAAYGKMLIRVNRLPNSADSLRHATRLDPNNVVVWNLLGSVYRQSNRMDEAREAFERSLALDPDQERTREVLKELTAPAASAP